MRAKHSRLLPTLYTRDEDVMDVNKVKVRRDKRRAADVKPGAILNLRGCRACSASLENIEIGDLKKQEVSCTKGGHWRACIECPYPYHGEDCKEIRMDCSSRVCNRLVLFKRKKCREGPYDVWYVEAVWEEGYN